MPSPNSQYHSFPASLLLESSPIPNWEYHIHTNYTDGQNGVMAMVEHAVSLGLKRLAFTEHTEPWQAKDPDWFRKYIDDIDNAQHHFEGKIELIKGLEAPAIDFEGGLELTDEMIEGVDYILGAAHRYPELGSRRVQDLPADEALELEFCTLQALIKSDLVDCIAHIGATCSKYCGPFPLDLTEEIVKSATEAGKAIEINHRYHYPLEDYLRICIKHDARIVPGTNAHRKENIGDVVTALQNIRSEFQKD